LKAAKPLDKTSTRRGITGHSAYGPRCRRRHFGPFFIKFCGYFPYTAQLYLNGQYAETAAMPRCPPKWLRRLGLSERDAA
jgi:hypothetical protein